MQIKIAYLADHMHYSAILATWLQKHWGSIYPNRTLEQWQEKLFNSKYRLPLTLVAINDAEEPKPVGMVTLRFGANEIFGAESIVELSGLYVDDAHRTHGIGSKLIRYACIVARKLNFKSLHLFTYGSGKIYHANGWELYRVFTHKGKTVSLMKRTLAMQYTNAELLNARGKFAVSAGDHCKSADTEPDVKLTAKL